AVSVLQCVVVWVLLAIASACFFFFQAEDGIRDDLVTGVQTCALPISGRRQFRALFLALGKERGRETGGAQVRDLAFIASVGLHRSEERRVGKECSSPHGGDE